LWLHYNQSNGCYHTHLHILCDQLSDFNIPLGNNLDVSWEDFCAVEAGNCAPPNLCHIDDWMALKAINIIRVIKKEQFNWSYPT